MKVQSSYLRVELTDVLDAKITTVRVGQQDAYAGDMVVVRTTIGLPTKEGTLYTPEGLRFGTRVSVLGETLSPTWGSYNEETGRREVSFLCNEKRWDDAFSSGEAKAAAEIKNLTDAIEARKQALIDAE